MPDNYYGPCGVLHSGPVNDKCTSHKRTTCPTAATKMAEKISSKIYVLGRQHWKKTNWRILWDIILGGLRVMP